MEIPGFCYNKAFWVVIPIMIVFFLGMMTTLTEQVNANTEELAQRDFVVNKLVPKIDTVSDINHDNIIRICERLNIDCKEK